MVGSLKLVSLRVHNCTEYFFGMSYPSSYTSGEATEYVISFNDEFVSVIGNQEVLWNFEYNGNLAMDSCYQVRTKCFHNLVIYSIRIQKISYRCSIAS